MKGKECDLFKYAEKCLYEYKRNLACLEILRNDLRVERAGSDVHCQNYQSTLSQTGTPSNPVQNRLLRIEQLEGRIQQLERYTQPVTRLIVDLKAPYVLDDSQKAELYTLMELYYFGQNSVQAVQSELKIGRHALYSRRRVLVKMLMGYMGA